MIARISFPVRHLLCLVGLFVATGLLTSLLTPQVHAADTSQFSAGRIIDDQVFFDPSGLSIGEIQAFLDAKVPTCDTYGTQPYGGTTRAGYGTSRGSPPPYTCLKNFLQQTAAKPADAYCRGYESVYKTAAELIYGVAQSCGINPRALIVLLQKEQGLITDDWPWAVQYRSATGYGCPDTAACDSQYYGFFNQLYNAARQFKKYAMNNSEFNYRTLRNNDIKWHPDFWNDSTKQWEDRCGSSTVYIENSATAGLYNYTPYRPNQAALSAGYGNGDGCSAYGNRNFWLYYTDWFGSTSVPSYRWTPHTQMSFTNGSADVAMPTTGRVEGERVYLIIKVKNAGAATWYKGQVNLALSNPTTRTSSVYDASWPSKDRPAYFYESSVPPGGEATYGFWANLSRTGTYREYFTLVADGITWLNDMGLYYEFSVEPARYNSQYLDQAVYTDQSKTSIANTTDYTLPGKRYYNVLRVKNTSNVAWKKGYVNLGTSNPTDRHSAVYDESWQSFNRAATLSESLVRPGETGTFEFWTKGPQTLGATREYFNLVAENIAWLPDYGIHFAYTVNKPYNWSMVSQQAFTDQSKTSAADLSNLSKNTRTYLQVKVRNTGTKPWNKDFVNLATSNPTDRTSAFRDNSWLSSNRLATLQENSVAPGEIGTFEAWVTTPAAAGTYKEYLNLVAENVTWFTDYGMYYPFVIK